MIGLGVAIRNSTGNLITTATRTSRYHGNVALVEATVIEWGIQVAKKKTGETYLFTRGCRLDKQQGREQIWKIFGNSWSSSKETWFLRFQNPAC